MIITGNLIAKTDLNAIRNLNAMRDKVLVYANLRKHQSVETLDRVSDSRLNPFFLDLIEGQTTFINQLTLLNFSEFESSNTYKQRCPGSLASQNPIKETLNLLETDCCIYQELLGLTMAANLRAVIEAQLLSIRGNAAYLNRYLRNHLERQDNYSLHGSSHAY